MLITINSSSIFSYTCLLWTSNTDITTLSGSDIIAFNEKLISPEFDFDLIEIFQTPFCVLVDLKSFENSYEFPSLCDNATDRPFSIFGNSGKSELSISSNDSFLLPIITE